MASFRNRVRLFSFILTVLVIWVHAVNGEIGAQLPDEAAGAVYFLQYLLADVLGQVAVPGFFCMSGYLFFRNVRGLIALRLSEKESGSSVSAAAAVFAGKWKSRIKSLVLPFVLWNLIYFIIYMAAGRAVFSPGALAEAILYNRWNPVFWYLRELIVITVFTPLIFVLLMKRRAAVPVTAIIYLAAVFYEFLPVHPINEDALFYYCVGAAAALHLKEVIEWGEENPDSARGGGSGCGGSCPGGKGAGRDDNDSGSRRRYLWPAAAGVTGFIFLTAEYIVFADGAGRYPVLAATVAGRISGVICVFAVLNLAALSIARREGRDNRSAGYPGRGAVSRTAFMNYNFFIYAVHYLEIRLFRLLMITSGVGTLAAETAGYILMPVFCVAGAVAAGSIMRKYLPSAYLVLTGFRKP